MTLQLIWSEMRSMRRAFTAHLCGISKMFCAYAVVVAAVGFLVSAAIPPEPALPQASVPAEFVGETAAIKLQAGRSVVLRPKADVRRTAVAAEGIVELAQLSPREIMLVGRREGKTTATFWFADPATPPVTYAIEVTAESPAPK